MPNRDKATNMINTLNLLNKIHEIYEVAYKCSIEDFDILTCLYKDITLLGSTQTMKNSALNTPSGPIRRLLKEYIDMERKFESFYDKKKIENGLRILKIQVGVCIDVMRHRNDFKLYYYKIDDRIEWGNWL